MRVTARMELLAFISLESYDLQDSSIGQFPTRLWKLDYLAWWNRFFPVNLPRHSKQVPPSEGIPLWVLTSVHPSSAQKNRRFSLFLGENPCKPMEMLISSSSKDHKNVSTNLQSNRLNRIRVEPPLLLVPQHLDDSTFRQRKLPDHASDF